MAVSLPNQALKQQLIRELAIARGQVAEEAVRTRAELRPMAIASRSFTAHTGWWVAGGVVAGLILVRIAFPPKIRSDISHKSARTRGISGWLRTAVMGYMQKAALSYAANHIPEKFTQSLTDRLQAFLNRYGPKP